jgi:hypothetical protein
MTHKETSKKPETPSHTIQKLLLLEVVKLGKSLAAENEKMKAPKSHETPVSHKIEHTETPIRRRPTIQRGRRIV